MAPRKLPKTAPEIAPKQYTIGVIGALTLRMSILIDQKKLHEPGVKIEEAVSAPKKQGVIEGAYNIALAAYRCCRANPKSNVVLKDYFPRPVQVEMVSVIGNDDAGKAIMARLQEEQIGTAGVRMLDDKPTDILFDNLGGTTDDTVNTQPMEGSRQATSLRYPQDHPATPACWRKEDFTTPESLGGSVIPDLVIISAKLEKDVLETILKTAEDKDIDVVLAAVPESPIDEDLFKCITYCILKEPEAEKLANFGPDVRKGTYRTTHHLARELGVKAVILPSGTCWYYHWGSRGASTSCAYDENDTEVGVDTFVGVFSTYCLVQRGKWGKRQEFSLGLSIKVASAAAAIAAGNVAGRTPYPWYDEIDGLAAPGGSTSYTSRFSRCWTDRDE
ncbi:hypothetical protein BDP55DRAFT_632069 [Colletotrichum godetiae]|uniref:Carbohydrate kinase PfkB domain-containing protein n=1 Tax=Colletotrichum godetiae TaxID=1209918 RepID=A0AAJ0ETT7_9PEZI|nr:uncharacterized protein BDP55DRAFT_632069 [Colletotrichum godetiae]KAK1675382.1 hypothetical protein BDP55DRAFT_632069 [Colletotrichum godetiae]